MKISFRDTDQRGFTIIELMIALSVLSTILIMSTFILIQIGSLYSKGVNAANLQNTNRTVVADVASALQFSGNQPESGQTSYGGVTVHSYCMDRVRYSYVLNRELGTDIGVDPPLETPHVMWRDTMVNANNPCLPLNITQASPVAPTASPSTDGAGYEVVPKKVRLTKFDISPTTAVGGNIYNLDVWMAYGDSDLVTPQADGKSTCQGGKGTQFCAVSEISTTVAGRLY